MLRLLNENGASFMEGGSNDGNKESYVDGDPEGCNFISYKEGSDVGISVGIDVGTDVGDALGTELGSNVGSLVGTSVRANEGAPLRLLNEYGASFIEGGKNDGDRELKVDGDPDGSNEETNIG